MFKKIMEMMQEYIDKDLIEIWQDKEEDDPHLDGMYRDTFYRITFDDSDRATWKIGNDIWQWIEDHAIRIEEGIYSIFYYFDDCVISCDWKIGAGA